MENLRAAEAEKQATKGGDRELRQADGRGRGGRWAGGQVRSEAGKRAVVLPPPWLLGQGMDIFSLSTMHCKCYK